MHDDSEVSESPSLRMIGMLELTVLMQVDRHGIVLFHNPMDTGKPVLISSGYYHRKLGGRCPQCGANCTPSHGMTFRDRAICGRRTDRDHGLVLILEFIYSSGGAWVRCRTHNVQ